jgi:hypothetical protein
VDDAGAHKVLRVGVDAVQQLHAKANQLGANGRDVQWLRCLEDLLRSLLVSVGKNISHCRLPNVFFLNGKNGETKIMITVKLALRDSSTGQRKPRQSFQLVQRIY